MLLVLDDTLLLI